MRKALSVMLAICLLQTTFAQQNSFHSQIDISVGVAAPVGSFGSKDINSDKSGIAANGAVVQVAYTRLIKKNYGLAISLIGLINPLDHKSLEKSFNQTKILTATPVSWSGIGPPPNQQNASTTYSNWDFKKANWKLGSLLVGGYTEFASGQTILNMKAMIGAVYVSSPEVDGSAATDTSTAHVTQTSETAFGFGYSISAGIKLKLTRKVFFTVSTDYIGSAKLTFKDATATLTTTKSTNTGSIISITQTSYTGEGKQVVSVITGRVGISLKL